MTIHDGNPVKMVPICRMEIHITAPQSWAKGSQTQGHLKKKTENDFKRFGIQYVYDLYDMTN